MSRMKLKWIIKLFETTCKQNLQPHICRVNHLLGNCKQRRHTDSSWTMSSMLATTSLVLWTAKMRHSVKIKSVFCYTFVCKLTCRLMTEMVRVVDANHNSIFTGYQLTGTLGCFTLPEPPAPGPLLWFLCLARIQGLMTDNGCVEPWHSTSNYVQSGGQLSRW